MTIVQLIDDVTAWAKENICDQVTYKRPPTDEELPTDADYDYELVHPNAFPLYIPTKDKLPALNASVYPFLCVRFVEGADQLDGSGSSIGVQFILGTWDPGLHSKDIFRYQGGVEYSQKEDPSTFVRSAEGWRDAWNFLDVTRRAIIDTTNIAGYELDVASGVHYGPWEEMDGSQDFYPYWLSWIQFSLNYPLVRNVPDFNSYL